MHLKTQINWLMRHRSAAPLALALKICLAANTLLQIKVRHSCEMQLNKIVLDLCKLLPADSEIKLFECSVKQMTRLSS